MSANRGVTASFRLLPPGTTITKVKISSKQHQAKVSFKAIGTATGFQCALVTQPNKHGHKKEPQPHFTRCKSGAPWMIGGDSRSRFRPEQGFWSSERRVEVACASAAGLWTARWAPCPAIVGTADACSSGQGWPRLRAGASG